jgi:4-hydroxybutyrate CoA-transferase
MSWLDKYRNKIISLEDAAKYVTSNSIIFLSGNAATPGLFIEKLAARKDDLENVQVNHLLMMGEDPLSAQGMEKHFRHNSLFVGPADRAAVNEGRSDYVPIFLFEIPSIFMDRLIPLNFAYVHVSPPDEHGFMSFGVECVASKAAAESADFVVAQVNEHMPRTLGDSFLHISRVHKIVEYNQEIPILNKKGFTEVERKIGEYIAGLVDDGATVQMGIGGIPDAVLAALENKKDLGVHTEMISDGIVEGIEKGFITNRKKTLHPGKVIGTFVLGSQRLYDFVDNNPYFEIHPTNYTNNPFVVAQNDNMIAINSAIEVDITGQVCSDSIGTRIYSGFGGQVDFIRGAAYSKGGKPIIALPSTAKNDTLSKITTQLKPGAGVVTTRADVHYVVTEYGIAYLHGKNLRQRAQELANIAHPNFRDELIHYAKKQKYM